MRSCALGFFLTPQENCIPTAEPLCLSANLGADATASGSRHDRLWDVTRTFLGRDMIASGTAFAEKQWVWSGR